MRWVQPGDTVFWYVNKHLFAVGYATSTGDEAPRPEEFDQANAVRWDRRGWRVDVEFTRIPASVKPTEFFAELATHLPDKYSPLIATYK